MLARHALFRASRTTALLAQLICQFTSASGTFSICPHFVFCLMCCGPLFCLHCARVVCEDCEQYDCCFQCFFSARKLHIFKCFAGISTSLALCHTLQTWVLLGGILSWCFLWKNPSIPTVPIHSQVPKQGNSGDSPVTAKCGCPWPFALAQCSHQFR